MATLRGLLERIQKTYTQPDNSYIQSQKSDTDNGYEAMKSEMRKHFRPQWKSRKTSRIVSGKMLKYRQLSNWEISRIGLAERSYRTPKGHHKSVIITHTQQDQSSVSPTKLPVGFPTLKTPQQIASPPQRTRKIQAPFLPNRQIPDKYFGFMSAPKSGSNCKRGRKLRVETERQEGKRNR